MNVLYLWVRCLAKVLLRAVVTLVRHNIILVLLWIETNTVK